MTFTTEQTGMLTAKLDPRVVKKNPKGHDYIEGWRVIDEANRIFGHDGWAREMASLAQVAEPYKGANDNWRVAYRAVVKITVYAGDRLIVREGTGYGSGIAKDLNDAHEGAVKEAETDAMKRALMTFGNPFGLALYDKDRANVGYDEPAPLEPEGGWSDWAVAFEGRCKDALTLHHLEAVKNDTAEWRARLKLADPIISAAVVKTFKTRQTQLAAIEQRAA